MRTSILISILALVTVGCDDGVEDVELASRVPGAEVGVVAGGTSHTCAVKRNGDVYCWGANGDGQLGNATNMPSPAPVLVLGMGAPAKQVDVGAAHSCAVTAAGQVRCWGDNNFFQLGDGTNVDRNQATPVPGLSNVVQVATGERHTCALLGDGTVRCWGFGLNGNLGNGLGMSSPVPVQVVALTNVVSIAAGAQHTCAAVSNGQAKCWGLNNLGQLGDNSTSTRLAPSTVWSLTNVTQLSAGSFATCALGADGHIDCWGDNSHSELAMAAGGNSTIPVAVVSSVNYTSVHVGDAHVCALGADGTPRCWGNALEGRLGRGMPPNPSEAVPTPPAGLSGVPTLNGVVAMGLGGKHSCAVRSDANVVCWGRGLEGQIGDNNTMERDIPVTTLFTLAIGVDLALTQTTTCAALSTGPVRCWGFSGGGMVPPPGVWTKTGIDQVEFLAGGNAHFIGLRVDGTGRSWGTNDQGQLGDGTVGGPATTPVVVSGLADAVTGDAGLAFSCALEAYGAVRCWGDDSQGQLGNGLPLADSSLSVAVSGITDAVAVAAGEQHACAVTVGGSVLCWGDNSNGQLGDNTITDRNAPVPTGITDGVDVAAGALHTCALRAGGTVSCWGKNSVGQLGDGTTMEHHAPTPVPGLTTVVQIAAGANHTCARLAVGAVKCWGFNDHGQIGDGTTTERHAPVFASGIGSPVELEAGPQHTCVVLNDSTARCWGRNDLGQVNGIPGPDKLFEVNVPGFP